MIDLIRKLTILAAVILIVILGYRAFFHNSSKNWITYNKPQLAAYTSLEQDELILEELERQTRFGSFKPLDPAFFVKPNIFQIIER